MTFDSVKDVITRLVDTHKLSSIIVTNKDLTETEIQTLDLDGNSIFVPSNSVKSIFEEIYGKEQIDKIIN
jgi:hypothetical protein